MRGKKLFLNHTLFCLSVFFCCPGFSQQNETDSLNILLHRSTVDTTKLRILVELTEACEVNDILNYSQPAEKLADKLLSTISDEESKKKILKLKSQALNNTGYAYMQKGEIAKALDYYHLSLDISEKLGDKTKIANSLNNIGYIYQQEGDDQNALDYFDKSLSTHKQIADQDGVANLLNNIGLIYENRNEISQALDYFNEGLKTAGEIKDEKSVALSLGNMGYIYMKQNNLPEAQEYYLKSLAIQKEIDDEEGMAFSLNYLADLYFQQGNTKEALVNCDSSLNLSRKMDIIENSRNAENLLYRIYKKMGDAKNALQHYEEYIAMHDSIENEEIRKAADKKQFQYEYEKKTIAMKAGEEKEHALEVLEEKKKNTIIISVLSGFVLLVIFSAFLFNRFRVTSKQKKIIEEKNKIVEKKQKEILDSIHYAKRIQQSLLPTEKYIGKNLKRLKD